MKNLIYLILCVSFTTYSFGSAKETLNLTMDLKEQNLELIEQAKASNKLLNEQYVEVRKQLEAANEAYLQRNITKAQLNEIIKLNNELVALLRKTRAEVYEYKDQDRAFDKKIKSLERQVALESLQSGDSLSHFEVKDFGSGTSINFSQYYCSQAKAIRAKIKDFQSSKYDSLKRELRVNSELCFANANINQDRNDIVGFELKNRSKNKINPNGDLFTSNSSFRSYNFQFQARSLQDSKLIIREYSALTHLDSHDTLLTTMVFLPRKNIPYIKPNENEKDCVRTVVLQTGEEVVFHALSKEIIDGVLKELPMDMNPSRHQRKFANVTYRGKGILIRADRRGGIPHRNHKVSWSEAEKGYTKSARVFFQDKECKVPKEKLWANVNNQNKTPYFKYENDQDVLEKVINPICGWNLTLEDLE